MTKQHWKWIYIVGGLYVLFVAHDSWKAYQTPTGVTSKWNIFARLINWRVQSSSTAYGVLNHPPPGAGNDWSFAWDETRNQAV
jgi:hypothetical protein